MSIVNDKLPDVVYELSSGLWACCLNATSPVQCYDPFEETFGAPPPQSLTTLFYIPLTGFSPTSQLITITSTSSSPTSTSLAPSTSSSGTPAPRNSGLSTGADAGIGVGVGLVGVVAIGTLLFVLLWRRRRPRSGAAGPGVAEIHRKPAVESQWRPVVEVPAYRPAPVELSNWYLSNTLPAVP
jgi:hypothetical protein